MLAGLVVVTGLVSALLYRPFLVLSFNEQKAQLLELRSRNMESQFERFLLGMNDDSPVLIIMEDAFGLRTEIRFGKVERNPELDPALFEFTPPEGVDVIGVLPGPGQPR